MGNYVIHIEGAGIHDNGREDDADAMLKTFAGQLAAAGHQVHSATFTTGSARELLNPDETTPLKAEGEHVYRHRAH